MTVFDSQPESHNNVWRKASRSSGGNACIEVALRPGSVSLRDSKNAADTITVNHPHWTSFIDAVKSDTLG
jgi:hypothetical protein